MFRHTLNILCVFIQCGFVSPWLCVGERDVAVTRGRERERGVFGVFSFSTISFQPAARFVPVLTSIVPSVSFHNPLY